MSITAKTPHLSQVATLLALAGIAAGLSGSTAHLPKPQPVAAVAVALPAAASAAVAATVPPLPTPAAAAHKAAGDAAQDGQDSGDDDGDVPAEAATLEPIPVAIPEPAAALQVASPQPGPTPGLQAVSFQTSSATGASAPVPGDLATLRARLHWLSVQVDGRMLRTPDPASRLLLARSAAERAGLAEVGLDFRDVYGVITAETSWVARTGMGRNGVASQGLAQLEPATARALGVRDANDPVEAVHAAAKLLKEAGAWSARRIAGLRLSAGERAARLREGISVYYNLSSRARQHWNGLSYNLPLETRRHISNVRAGIAQAERLQTGTGPSADTLVADATAAARTSTATAPSQTAQRGATRPAAPVAPHPIGTISWSGHGSDADARRAGTHVVWSNGVVAQDRGRVHWSSRAPG